MLPRLYLLDTFQITILFLDIQNPPPTLRYHHLGGYFSSWCFTHYVLVIIINVSTVLIDVGLSWFHTANY